MRGPKLTEAFRLERDAINRRKAREREWRAFCSGGTIVFAGLLLAALYGLLTHQIPS